jgi:hypothetical protein
LASSGRGKQFDTERLSAAATDLWISKPRIYPVGDIQDADLLAQVCGWIDADRAAFPEQIFLGIIL